MKQRLARRLRTIVCAAGALIVAVPWRRSLLPLAAGATLLLGLVGPQVAAQEHGEEQHAEATAGEHEEHEFHRHHLSVFLGATTADVEVHGGEGEAGAESEEGETGGETTRETEASIGLDYEYRLNRRWGVGFLFDYVAGDARTSVAGIPVILHPVGGLKLLAAPGLEHHEGENEFLVRLGLMYDFEVGGWTIAPAVNVDFVDSEETYVYGVNIGRGF